MYVHIAKLNILEEEGSLRIIILIKMLVGSVRMKKKAMLECAEKNIIVIAGAVLFRN